MSVLAYGPEKKMQCRERGCDTQPSKVCGMCHRRFCDKHMDKTRACCLDCSYEMYKNSYGGM